MLNLAFRLVILVIALVLLGIPALASETLSEENRAALLDYDFSAELHAAPVQIDVLPGGSPVAVDDTAERQRHLGDMIVAGRPLGISDTVWKVCRWFRKHNDLPRDAVALFPELETAAGYEAFMALSPQERFDRYAIGVNRVTGKFHSTFYDSYHPGGLTLVPDFGFQYDRTYTIGHRTVTFKAPEGIDQQYKYKVFGAAGTEMIAWSDTIGFSGPRFEATNQPNGPQP